MRKSRLPQFIAPLLLLTVACLPTFAQKQKKEKAGYDHAARATILHDAIVYIAADTESQRVSLVAPGHEVVVIERSGPWVKVFANTDVADDQDEDQKPDFGEDQVVTPSSGWVRDKGVLSPSTPGGDAILFGAAANYEDLAAQPHAPKGAAAAAHLLYRRVAEYFPDSPLAPEAAWRSADVRWQIDRLDIKSLPSAKEQDAALRPTIYDGELKRVIKSYPGSKFAAQAAYELIDNKLCGDWQGLPRCPELETNLYEKYAQQYPDGPKTAEALYNATYRQGVLVTMYTVEENRKKADTATARTQSLALQLKAKFPQSDYTARAANIAYKVQQKIAIYGTDRD
jgi:outer membrane protein assembly factor BamD (BamD/ComL family)